jgi:hypothetical protein
MAHSKCYAVCESKCFVETLSKEEIGSRIKEKFEKGNTQLHLVDTYIENTTQQNIHLSEYLIDDEDDRTCYFVAWYPGSQLESLGTTLYLDVKIKINRLPTNKTKLHLFFLVDGVPKTGFCEIVNGVAEGTMATLEYSQSDFNNRVLYKSKTFQLVDYHLT